VDEDAGALAEQLDRADPRAGAAEKVLGEDRAGGPDGVVVCDRGDERRHVHVGRAGRDARRLGVRAAAREAPIRLDERLSPGKGWSQLLEWFGDDSRAPRKVLPTGRTASALR
jgi:hypothetical protein